MKIRVVVEMVVDTDSLNPGVTTALIRDTGHQRDLCGGIMLGHGLSGPGPSSEDGTLKVRVTQL